MTQVFLLLSALLSAAFISRVEAECANACNGHGKCTSYDMCICHRNWQANDCSERVCMHGLAHDTPKVSVNGLFCSNWSASLRSRAALQRDADANRAGG